MGRKIFYNKKKKGKQESSDSGEESDKSEELAKNSTDEDEEESQDGDDDDVAEEGDDGVSAKDGMADMMSKILNQRTSRSVPVLEKRKTAIMKTIDAERNERSELRRAQAARQMSRTRQLAQPGLSNPEKERALRKLATKGVVALFNAVAEAQRVQRDIDNGDGDLHGSKKDAKAAAVAKVDIKKMSKSNFLDLLTGNDATANQASVNEAGNHSNDSNSDDDRTAPVGSKWEALRDDYIREDAGVLKDFGKSEGDRGEDSEGSADDYLDDVKVGSSTKRISSQVLNKNAEKKQKVGSKGR